MSSFADVFKNLALQTGFATLTWKHYVMILIACVFMYLAIVKGFEPLLLVPISFGMFLVNMFPDIIAMVDCYIISICWMSGVFCLPSSSWALVP